MDRVVCMPVPRYDAHLLHVYDTESHDIYNTPSEFLSTATSIFTEESPWEDQESGYSRNTSPVPNIPPQMIYSTLANSSDTLADSNTSSMSCVSILSIFSSNED
ncbi:hypothetical protein PCE1_003933 [Barthelona sp. PCE]